MPRELPSGSSSLFYLADYTKPTMTKELEPKRFNPATASDSEFAAINAFHNALRIERWPEDSPHSVEDTISRYRHLTLFSDMKFTTLFVWNGSHISADANIHIPLSDNLHLAFSGVSVLAPYRRQGLATRLLPHLAAEAKVESRRLLNFGTNDAVPAGELFAERLEAKRGMAVHTNQLNVAELDASLFGRWQEAAPKDAFELGFWTGPYPEDELEAIAELIGVMNTAPRENLEMEDFHLTPEQLREHERYQEAVGTQRWVAYVRERSSGTLAGYTEMSWNPANPRVLDQGDTGVQPVYRGHGLGKWLKAAMLARVLSENTDVAYVRTGNADSNGPMLAINYALGFKPRMAEVWWELELEKLETYLATRRVS